MSNDGSQYDADYFLRGKQTGKSLYEDYRWLPDLTIPMCASIVSHLGIAPSDTILDFGCARGYTVRAFREMGYTCWGTDISQWALANADEVAAPYLSSGLAPAFRCDWVIAKDVLEHVDALIETVERLIDCARKGVFAVVPLSHDGRRYDVPEYEADVTHVHRRPLGWWIGYLLRYGWSVEGQYRVRGVKDNYSHYPTGNGFITCRRLSA